MIDLLIVNFNTKDKLERLVHTLWNSVENKYNRNWKLYITDNDSPDNSQQWIKENENLFDGIWFNRNIGYARAINKMFSQTTNPIFAALNADVWFKDSDIKELETAFDTYPNIAVLGPKQRDERNMITHAGIFGSLTAPKHRGWKAYDPTDKLFRDNCKSLTVSGSAFFMRRDVANFLTECPLYRDITPETVGPFLETRHYWEETYCVYHLHSHRFESPFDHPMEVWYWGAVSIGHSWHASSDIRTGHVDIPRNMIESKGLFVKACEHHRIPHD